MKLGPLALNCSLELHRQHRRRCKPLGEEHQWGWGSRLSSAVPRVRHVFWEARSSGLERKLGGKFHLKLNSGSRPIANKYHEGKVTRTLKRELKVHEVVEREANGTSSSWWDCCVLMWWLAVSPQGLQRALIWTCAVLLTFRINLLMSNTKVQYEIKMRIKRSR